MDSYLFNLIHSFAGKWRILDWLGIFLAEYLGYIFVLAVIFLFFKQKKWSGKIYFFSIISLSAILSRIIAETIKVFAERTRPYSILNFQPLIEANGVNASMPSGHAAFYFALALALFFFNKKVGWYFTGAAILMGIARIFTGVHWPADILIGVAIAAVSVLLVKKIIPSPVVSVTKTT